MELTIHERLKKFIEYKGLSNTAFGKPFKASRTEISNWTNGTKMNVYRISEMMEKYPELNGHWFICGKGNMLNNEGTYKPIVEICLNPECILERQLLREKNQELTTTIIELQRERIESLKKA